eukprot:424760_1
MASQTFRDTQIKWMQQLMGNSSMCDAVFEVGKEKKTMHGIRSLLGNISPVFRAQLFGSFAEAKKESVIEYPSISPDVFECIIRTSFCLDPNMNEHTVIPLMKAAQMLQIEPLVKECNYFLSNCIQENNVLAVLNSAYSLNTLNDVLLLKCKMIIAKKSNTILTCPEFISLHPDLLNHILSCDFFNVSEENIWTGCIKWANNVVSNSIQFPVIKNACVVSTAIKHNSKNNDDEPPLKKRKLNEENTNTNNSNISKTVSNTELIQLILPSIRIPLMGKEFFVTQVRSYLTREQAESVTDYYMLNR